MEALAPVVGQVLDVMKGGDGSRYEVDAEDVGDGLQIEYEE